MKTRRTIAISLAVIFALLACWQVIAAPAGSMGEFAAADRMDNYGGRRGGSRAGAFGYGMGAHEPELAGLMRDIIALHQINRADMSREQIGQVLPILRNLAREQDRHVASMRMVLMQERARLLAQSGPDTSRPVGIPDIRTESDAYRAKVETAKAELAKVLSAPQAQILSSMITPPGPFGHGMGPRAERRDDRATGTEPGGRRARRGREEVSPKPMDEATGAVTGGRHARRGREEMRSGPMDEAAGRPARRRGGDGMPGMRQAPGPMIELDRLIDLLQEKHAAMRGR